MTLRTYRTTEYAVFTLKVGRVYKGSLSGSVKVATGIGTADGTAAPDCLYPFEIGKDYLVYAESGLSEYGGLFYTSACSCTGMINGARYYAYGTEMYLRHLQRRPPRKEDKLSIKDLSKLYESRSKARISGSISGAEKKGFMQYGLWRLLDGEWHKWGFAELRQDGSYSCDRLEPGEYRIGFLWLLEDGSRKIGFYGGAERLEDARSVFVGPKSEINGIDFKLKPQSRHAVQGRIECTEENAFNGKIAIRTANSWDRNERVAMELNRCGSFQIPDAYSGKFRVIATLVPESLDPLDAWTISVPEIKVPEKANDIVLKLEHERLPERATSQSYPIWDIWTGKVQDVVAGDKIIVELGRGSNTSRKKLRIAGIICPQKGQSHWEEAKKLQNS